MLKKRKKGLTLVEVILVMALIIIGLVGVFVVYGKTTMREKENRSINDIKLIQTSVQQLYQSQGTYKGLDLDNALESHVLPDNMIDSDGETYNAFKGAIEIESYRMTKADLNDTSFRISYKNIPTEACINIISGLKYNFYAIYVNKTIVKSPTVDFSLSKLSTACANEGPVTGISFISN